MIETMDMNMNMNMVTSLLVVVLVATSSTMHSTYAFEYIVGNASSWVVPSGSLNNWAADYKFYVGDALVFNMVKDMHDVTSEDYEAMKSAGDNYLMCSFPQHVAINVCSTRSPSPSPSPPFMAPQSSPSNTNLTTIGN